MEIGKIESWSLRIMSRNKKGILNEKNIQGTENPKMWNKYVTADLWTDLKTH